MKIQKEVKDLFNKEPLVAFATADREGNPNVVPIYWKTILNDETILLIDNFMKMTKDNIEQNNKVCISFWNPETEEAYKIKGIATYHTNNVIYEEGKKYIQSKNPEKNPKGVVEIKVMEIYSIKPGEGAGETL